MLCKYCNIDKELCNFELHSNGNYRKQCKICVSKRRAKYYLSNKDSIKNKNTIYAKIHKHETNLYKKKWVINNPEKRKEVNRNSELRRRASKNNIIADIFTINDIIINYGNNCFYCGGKFEHVDHYIPLSKGGPHSLKNVRPSCKQCNLRKNSKMPEDFLKEVNFG